MIDKIGEYIKSLSIYVIMTGFISIILPNNSYKKYIGIIMGIILLEIATKPIGGLLM